MQGAPNSSHVHPQSSASCSPIAPHWAPPTAPCCNLIFLLSIASPKLTVQDHFCHTTRETFFFSLLEIMPLLSGKTKLLLIYVSAADAWGFPLTQDFPITPGSFLSWNLPVVVAVRRRGTTNLLKPVWFTGLACSCLGLWGWFNSKRACAVVKLDSGVPLKAEIIRNGQIWGEQPNWRAWVLCHHMKVPDVIWVKSKSSAHFFLDCFFGNSRRIFCCCFRRMYKQKNADMLTKNTDFSVFFLMSRKKRALVFSFHFPTVEPWEDCHSGFGEQCNAQHYPLHKTCPRGILLPCSQVGIAGAPHFHW